ncbi:MAG TPA: hypothetical protein VKU85_01340, partial [bacterium]|nr:hypothetical protein [bacterium]
RCTYFIDDLLFRDDPRLTPARERGMIRGRGGPGVADPQRGEDGTWIAVRDIRLGENVPGHPGTSAK